jgi:subtilase family serine protease
VPGDAFLTVKYQVGGSAVPGSDYGALPGTITIPAGTSSVAVAVGPVDDALVESNETVVVTLMAGSGYAVGTPASAMVSIVSDDVAPDLTVSAMSAPRAAAAGGTIALTDTTRNQGAGAAPASQTAFYLSINAILDSADTLLGARAVPELAAGAVSSGTTSVPIPDDLLPGTYLLLAKADGPGVVPESSESNNTRTASIVIGPDLVISALTVPLQAAAGGSVTVTDTTSNQGPGSATASTTHFYLSVNTVLDPSDVKLAERSVPVLGNGLGSSDTTLVTIPVSAATGAYYVLAKADGAGQVGESNENNNLRSAPVRIGPDLIVSAVTAPARGAAGGSITVTDTTRNGGGGPAPTSTTAFYLSPNAALDAGDTRLAAVRHVPLLNPSEGSTGTTTLLLPGVAPGTWYLFAQADDAKAVAETLESNNSRAAIVRIGPDLNFASASSPSTAVAGTAVTVTAAVRNSGGDTAAASVVRFYLSNDTSFDAGDLELSGSWNVPALAPDATRSAATIVTIPAGKTGTSYLLLVADSGQAVAESNEANNVAARLVQIAAGG